MAMVPRRLLLLILLERQTFTSWPLTGLRLALFFVFGRSIRTLAYLSRSPYRRELGYSHGP